jgi:hypothetical protein
MGLENGIQISTGGMEKSCANAFSNWWERPKNIGKLGSSNTKVYFAGGKSFSFNPLDIEVWGLN